jgi:hypothetical protein
MRRKGNRKPITGGGFNTVGFVNSASEIDFDAQDGWNV